MVALFESGRVIELILALMLIEALILSGLALFGRTPVPLAGLLLNLTAGACLLLALRAVLMDASWTVVGTWLALALMTHLADLMQRLRRESRADKRD